MKKMLKSKLASYIEGLIAEKIASGYSFTASASLLYSFDAFLMAEGLDSGYLDERAVREWELLKPTENLNTRNSRVSIVRMLAKYMTSLGAEVCYPLSHCSEEHAVPYIPDRDELHKLFCYIDSSRSKNLCFSRFDIEYPIIVRLYYCCGLRLNEVVVLRRSDVNLETGNLYIRHSKGDKDRLVFIADDFLALIRSYDAKMEAEYVKDREWFFPGFYVTRHFSKSAIDVKFMQWWMDAFPNWEGKRPTVHALRHAFVVHRVNDWVEEGNELSAIMPYLSRYLGHSSIEETMYYYHQLDAHTNAVKNFMTKCSSVVKGVSQCR
ncbi:MAG: tyrosine-type recombinase/integrase [Sphaerochaeta sp.]|nr:tyrosine-type recombinase/integrase [Sphaerochaeta sp.]